MLCFGKGFSLILTKNIFNYLTMERDTVIFDLIKKECQRQKKKESN